MKNVYQNENRFLLGKIFSTQMFVRMSCRWWLISSFDPRNISCLILILYCTKLKAQLSMLLDFWVADKDLNISMFNRIFGCRETDFLKERCAYRRFYSRCWKVTVIIFRSSFQFYWVVLSSNCIKSNFEETKSSSLRQGHKNILYSNLMSRWRE